MQTIVSKIGTSPCDISQYLVKLIQPTLNKSKYNIKKPSSFVNEAKNWLVRKEMKSKCLDIINLYPLVPINKALDVLKYQINNDKADLMTRTKLFKRYLSTS